MLTDFTAGRRRREAAREQTAVLIARNQSDLAQAEADIAQDKADLPGHPDREALHEFIRIAEIVTDGARHNLRVLGAA
jgi:hypothetical protein